MRISTKRPYFYLFRKQVEFCWNVSIQQMLQESTVHRFLGIATFRANKHGLKSQFQDNSLTDTRYWLWNRTWDMRHRMTSGSTFLFICLSSRTLNSPLGKVVHTRCTRKRLKETSLSLYSAAWRPTASGFFCFFKRICFYSGWGVTVQRTTCCLQEISREN